MIVADTREVWRCYDVPEPSFGTAPDALLRGLAEIQQCELHTISCVQTPVRTPALLHGCIQHHSLLVPKLGWLRSGYSGCIAAIRRRLREIKPDLVHGQGTERFCAWSAVWSGYPNVITIHGNMRRIARLGGARPFSFEWLTARLESCTVPRTDGVVCITRHTQSEVGGAAPRTWLVPNAVDPAFFEIKAEPSPERTILCVGMVSAIKNQNQLLRALDPWVGRTRFRLVVLGAVHEHAPYGREFMQMIKGRPWCDYSGFAGREILRQHLSQASLLVLPSIEDNCPMVVLEAMAAGVPVAASAIGGIPDLITDGDTGVLFNPNDLADMGSKVGKLLENPSWASEIAARAKRRAWDRYRPAVVAGQHMQIYREMAG